MTLANIKLSYIKDNLSLILLIPTILGGFWQVFELSSISISLIRFFSVGQLIADGLLIIFLLLIILLASKFSSRLTTSSLKEGDEFKSINITRAISITLLGTIWISIFIYKTIITQKISAIGLVISIFFLTCIVIYSFHFINLKKVSKKIKKHFWLDTIWRLTLYSISVGILMFIGESLELFHKTFLLPENLKNITQLECYLQKEVKGLNQYEILYFNDKYIFVETQKNNKSMIEIIETKQLFNKNCNKNN